MMYEVNLETYDNKLIENLGVLDLEQIRNLAKEYIGDVFKDNEHIDRVIDYIIETGEEMWLANNNVQITIQRVSGGS